MYKKIGQSKTLSQRIEEEIEGAIRSKKLKSGEKLPTEIELSKSYGVSRNALREALRSLNSKGLIRIEKGRGMFVNEYSLAQAMSTVNIFLDHTVVLISDFQHKQNYVFFLYLCLNLL